MTSAWNRRLLVVSTDMHSDEVAASEAEDALVSNILSQARKRTVHAVASPEDNQRNAKFMAKMHSGSAQAFLRRVKNKELLTKEEFIEALGGKRRWVHEAMRAGSLFSLIDPGGQEYFPAFFADTSYDRRALTKVTQALEGLPSESKYFFFTRKSTRLQMTALEALAQGKNMEVVGCALTFATT
jgi:hypothetical protein